MKHVNGRRHIGSFGLVSIFWEYCVDSVIVDDQVAESSEVVLVVYVFFVIPFRAVTLLKSRIVRVVKDTANNFHIETGGGNFRRKWGECRLYQVL